MFVYTTGKRGDFISELRQRRGVIPVDRRAVERHEGVTSVALIVVRHRTHAGTAYFEVVANIQGHAAEFIDAADLQAVGAPGPGQTELDRHAERDPGDQHGQHHQ